jgi:uncharacterized membrane protein
MRRKTVLKKSPAKPFDLLYSLKTMTVSDTTTPSLIPNAKNRIESIDVLRGIVMVIMALDHTRDFFHPTAWIDDPLNLTTTTPALYFTRWITHFCAPIFVFLSGTSIYLQSLRKTKAELSLFLLKRGLWLIIAEVLIVSLGLSFLPYNFILLQVIWVIGFSMVLMAALIRLPFRVILGLGLVMVVGHNALDFQEQSPGFEASVWWVLLHGFGNPVYFFAENRAIVIGYPLLPWPGVMMLGYCLGRLFSADFLIERRRRWLVWLGTGLLLLFVVLRLANGYGNPFPWSVQKDGLFTFLSFINVNKYPPSLLYLCVTIGPGLLALAAFEGIRNGFTAIMKTYGRTAFFYYLIHWYVLHTLRLILFFAHGHTLADALPSLSTIPVLGVLPGEGYPLPVVYGIWAAVVSALYPLCRWYDGYKSSHKEKRWLSYL